MKNMDEAALERQRREAARSYLDGSGIPLEAVMPKGTRSAGRARAQPNKKARQSNGGRTRPDHTGRDGNNLVHHGQSDGNNLLNQVHAFLKRFVSYPSEHASVAHTLWIVHAHLMEVWESTPRIAFLSPEPGSGKTRALEVTELLVPNSVEAVNVTPAYIFRKIGEETPPTILHDEIDTVFGAKAKNNEELRALLNAGHRRGAVVGRCVVRESSRDGGNSGLLRCRARWSWGPSRHHPNSVDRDPDATAGAFGSS
jgi:hypothetical protein